MKEQILFCYARIYKSIFFDSKRSYLLSDSLIESSRPRLSYESSELSLESSLSKRLPLPRVAFAESASEHFIFFVTGKFIEILFNITYEQYPGF